MTVLFSPPTVGDLYDDHNKYKSTIIAVCVNKIFIDTFASLFLEVDLVIAAVLHSITPSFVQHSLADTRPAASNWGMSSNKCRDYSPVAGHDPLLMIIRN